MKDNLNTIKVTVCYNNEGDDLLDILNKSIWNFISNEVRNMYGTSSITSHSTINAKRMVANYGGNKVCIQ